MRKERSIRSVPIPRGRHSREDEADSILYEREEIEVEQGGSFSFRRLFLWGSVIVFIALLAFALGSSFAGATITVTPKVESVSLQHEFTASRGSGAKLRFETLPINETAETTIPADTTKKVAERASGTIVIYNAFSDKPQRLIKNTRFETRDGLIYRVSSSVTVPGKTLQSGRVIPGSVEAVVTADAPGTDYNIPLSDFTVPGFKSDAARFAGFYARSKTPMAGGFDGTVKTPGEEALKNARGALDKQLEEKIAKEKQGLLPPGYVLFDGAVQTHFESLPTEERPKNMAAVKETATGAMYLFKKEDIVKAITESAPRSQGDAPAEIPDLSALSFELVDAPTGDPTKAKNITFTLTGDVNVIWLYDENKLKSALVGKPKADLANVLGAFPTIVKADLVLRPFWRRSFPDNPDKLSIKRAPLPTRPNIPSNETP